MSEHDCESSFDLTNLLKGSLESPCVHRARFDKITVQNHSVLQMRQLRQGDFRWASLGFRAS